MSVVEEHNKLVKEIENCREVVGYRIQVRKARGYSSDCFYFIPRRDENEKIFDVNEFRTIQDYLDLRIEMNEKEFVEEVKQLSKATYGSYGVKTSLVSDEEKSYNFNIFQERHKHELESKARKKKALY
jgi:hypothetical protein